MSDININLLPWREQLREEKKQEFINILVVVVVVAGLIILGIDRYYAAEINTQDSRNRFITDEIKVLEGRIDEIKLLQQKRKQLLARMKVIQELQGNRPIIVRVFDELARKLTDRVFFTSVEMKGKGLAIKGIAESNPRISSQLRNFDESKWFGLPNVTEINANPSYGPQASRFELSVIQTTPAGDEEGGD